MIRSERGYVLLLLSFVLALSAGIVIAVSITSSRSLLDDTQSMQTIRSLNAAKQSLILKALTETSTPGTLPCPTAANGTITSSCSTIAAATPSRLPFKELGLDTYRDAAGECLWYAISPDFRKSITAEKRSDSTAGQLPINPDNFGTLQYRASPGGTVNPVVAVIVAPGPPLAGQNRSHASVCAGGDIPDFLESYDSVSKVFTAPAPDDILANDRIVAITRDELLQPILRLVLSRFQAEPPGKPGIRWLFSSPRLAAAADLRRCDAGSDCANMSPRFSLPSALLLNKAAAPNTQQVDDRLNRGLATATFDDATSSDFTLHDQFDEALGFSKWDFDDSVTPCNGVVNPDSAKYATSAAWLCFNRWYDYIEYHADDANRRATLTLKLDRRLAQSYGCKLTTAQPPAKDVLDCGLM